MSNKSWLSLLALFLLPLSGIAQDRYSSNASNYDRLFGRARGSNLANQQQPINQQGQNRDALFSQRRSVARFYPSATDRMFGRYQSSDRTGDPVEDCRRWLLFRDGNDRTWSQARLRPWGADPCEQIVWQANRGYYRGSSGYRDSGYYNGDYRDDGSYRDDQYRPWRYPGETPPIFGGSRGVIRVTINLELLFGRTPWYRHR